MPKKQLNWLRTTETEVLTMSERKKVKFSEGELSGEFSAAMEAGSGDGKVSRFKAKHSLDSDEEDEPDNYDLMKEDDIEGNNMIFKPR